MMVTRIRRIRRDILILPFREKALVSIERMLQAAGGYSTAGDRGREEEKFRLSFRFWFRFEVRECRYDRKKRSSGTSRISSSLLTTTPWPLVSPSSRILHLG